MEDCRDLGERKVGDAIRGEPSGDGDSREENRLSKGCRDVGRWERKELCDAGTLLPGDDSIEPWSI